MNIRISLFTLLLFVSSFSVNAMEEESCSSHQPVENGNTMQLQFSNQSKQTASFFFSKGSNAPRMLAPYQSSDLIATDKNDAIYAHTSAGAWVIEPDQGKDLLTLFKLASSHDDNNADDTLAIDKEIVKQVSASQAKDILFIINPNGQAGMFLRAVKKSEVFSEKQISDSEEKANEANCDDDDIMLTIEDQQEISSQAIPHDAPGKEIAVPAYLTSSIPAQDKLSRAIINNSAEEVKLAIKAGARVNKEKDGKSPLLWAVLLKRPNAVEALLEASADAGKTSEELIQYAVKLYDIKSAYLLANKDGISIDQGYEPASSGYGGETGGGRWTLLSHAIIQNDFETALNLLNKGAAIGPLNYDIVMSYVIRRLEGPQKNPLALKLLEKILDRGYQADKIWEYNKIGKENDGIDLNVLRAHGRQDLNDFGVGRRFVTRPNIYQKSVLKLLIEHGANPNYVIDINKPDRSSGGVWTWTPLFRAIAFDKKDAVEFLLDAGASINMQANPISNLKSFTPLSFAIHLGRVEIVELLLKNGASI